MTINIDKVQIKTGNKANLPNLSRGEQALTVDTKELHINDGSNNVTFVDKSYVDSGLGEKSNTGHSHDDRYYTETETNNLLSGKAPTSHIHTKSQITDFPTIATTVEAEAGLDDTKIMTPKKVAESIKANASGGVVLNTFRSGVVDGKFTATEPTNTFVIPNWNNRLVIDSLVYRNVNLVVGVDYNINKENGTVTLGWDLKIGESIYFQVSGQSYNYNDLSGLPTIPSPVTVENVLTSTSTTNALSANMGKELSERIANTNVDLSLINSTIGTPYEQPLDILLKTPQTQVVTNLTAKSISTGIEISYTRPQDVSFGGVIIVKNENHTPVSPTDGSIIYDGQLTTFVDTNAKVEDKKYFYTVFSKNIQNVLNYDFSSNVTHIYFYMHPTIWGISIPTNDSNPNCGVYTDACAGYTQADNSNLGSWENSPLLKLIKPCVLREDGTVNYYLDKSNRNLKTDGTPANLTGVDGDIMVEIPKLYWYMNTSSTIKLANYKVDSNYQCLAHTQGSQELDKIYVSSYLGFNDGGKLRSISNVSPTVSQTIGTFRTQAQSRTNWQQMDFNTLTLLQILYLLIYKNRDSQTQLGKGLTSSSDKVNTGWTNDKPWCFGYTGTNDGLQQNCFLGIEDFYGNCYYWIDGLFSDASRNILTSTNNYNDTGNGYTNQGSSGYTSNFGNYFTNIQGSNNTGFLPKGTTVGSSSTYYADFAYLYASGFAIFGGRWSNGAAAGAFRLSVNYSASGVDSTVAARCVYKG